MATTPAKKQSTVETVNVHNKSGRLYTVGGVALVPGQVTKVPVGHEDVNKRDIEELNDLEIVSGEGDSERKESIETKDVLSAENLMATNGGGWAAPTKQVNK